MSAELSIVIPTYHRGEVLINTLTALLDQDTRAQEILVIDQTPAYSPEVNCQLRQWHTQGTIIWHRLSEPSIIRAMNTGLEQANTELVLFLDDDIIPSKTLISAHIQAHTAHAFCAVSGQVLQPGQSTTTQQVRSGASALYQDLDFKFNCSIASNVNNCMAGNLSVKRELALSAGGFDENFVGVAYRFETEFAKRLIQHSGLSIRFEPRASLQHLQAPSGGTRQYGNHLRSNSPAHSVGDYYYALRLENGWERYRYIIERLFRSIRTRFHLTHPWWIPNKWLGEWRGLALAIKLYRSGKQHLRGATDEV